MKKLLLIIILLLVVPTVLADVITLSKGQSTTFKSLPIELINIGTSGSAVLKIADQTKTISKSQKLKIYGIEIQILSSSPGEFAELSIEQVADCLMDADCKDLRPCTNNICKFGKCEEIIQNGCIHNDECRAYGSLAQIEGILYYCAETNKWLPRKDYKEPCTQDYHCLSNQCNQTCTLPPDQKQEQKMAPAWILIIIGIVLMLKSILFILNPKLAKRITNNVIIKTKDQNLKILFIITFFVGLALIIWALI